MTELIFQEDPTVELLQWLARGSLKQNLLRAIRLWVWLKILYGEESKSLDLFNSFKFADWQKAFFTHSPTDDIPPLHDVHCNCAKTVSDWLKNILDVEERQWRNSLKQHDKLSDESIDRILQTRLFAVTRRSLQDDLRILVELGWLKKTNTTYIKVDSLPEFPQKKDDSSKFTALIPELDLTLQNFVEPIGGCHRFFLEVDFIISPIEQDQLEDQQIQLKELWQQMPTPPVELTYDSAKLEKVVQCIVYPICLYYSRRAIYLCAFGETPNEQGNFYNYRLDRIARIVPLSWQDSHLPFQLLECYPNQLPDANFIQEEMGKVWGFDFYLPSQLMLLRFERDFHDKYINNTFRHQTFEEISYQQAKKIFQKNLNLNHPEMSLQLLESRSPNDAYYCVNYRDGDINVIHRLRAWRPHVEILLPEQLRQQFRQEIMAETQFYLNP